jgi:ribosome-associated protein
VTEDPSRVRVTPTLVISAGELTWRFSRSGGPGGQHANTSDTRAEVRFDIAGSPSLGPRQRARLLERLGPEARAAADEERSQARNRSRALERLCAQLEAALRVQPARRPTRPTRAGVERRLDAKRRQAARKTDRRRPHPE